LNHLKEGFTIHVVDLVECSYNTARFVEEHQGRKDDIHIYGQEFNADTWKLAKMNLAIRGIDGNLR